MLGVDALQRFLFAEDRTADRLLKTIYRKAVQIMTIDRIPANTKDDFLFNLIEDNGEKRECAIHFSYHWEKTGRTYIAFLDGFDENDVLMISHYIVDTEHGNRLYPVESKEELDMLAWKDRKSWYEDESGNGWNL